MQIGSICNRDVIFVKADTSVVDAARLMREFHVGDLVVVSEEHGQRVPVGILTDRDIVVEVVAKEVRVAGLNVGEIMSGSLVTGVETEGLFEIIDRMESCGVRRVPIVNAAGALVGVVSLDDLLGVLSEELASLSRVSPIEEVREMRARV